MKKIAVILCGSGFKDGSEIHESVGVLWALSEHPVAVQCFAPDAPQADVVNCLTGKVVSGEQRNMLVESARIARGAVRPLAELRPDEFDAIILPGGFGAAKNLCTFASLGCEGTVLPELATALQAMHAQGKPIGAVCIAPAVVALAFPSQGFELTLGATSAASQAIEMLGHQHVVCRTDECHVDRKARVATTPAYMHDDGVLKDIFVGIRKLVAEVVAMAPARG